MGLHSCNSANSPRIKILKVHWCLKGGWARQIPSCRSEYASPQIQTVLPSMRSDSCCINRKTESCCINRDGILTIGLLQCHQSILKLLNVGDTIEYFMSFQVTCKLGHSRRHVRYCVRQICVTVPIEQKISTKSQKMNTQSFGNT